MMRFVAILGASLVCVVCTSARGERVLANFHAHADSEDVGDDGSEPTAHLHAALAERGFRFSAHTPHSTLDEGPDAVAAWRRQRAREAALDERLTVTVGQELTVAPGPRYQKQTMMLGHQAPGNLDHLSLVGSDRFVPSGTDVATACRRAHEGGGICIVNHPGPGPMMWEEGLWERAGALVDGLEVYNGQALAAVGVDFEGRYLQATSYGGLGLKIAAVTGADTHGPSSVARARDHLRGFGAPGRLLAALAPQPVADRPELEAATMVEAASPKVADVVQAVRARRTIASWALRDLQIDVAGLGEVHKGTNVDLHISLSRPVDEIALYREGQLVKRWTKAARADFAEAIAKPAAYVWAVRDRGGKAMASAIWYEP